MWKPTKATEGIEAPFGLGPWREMSDEDYLAGERLYFEHFLGSVEDDAPEAAKREHDNASRRLRLAIRERGYYEHVGDDKPAEKEGE